VKTIVSRFAARSSQLAVAKFLAPAIVLGLLAERPALAQFMHECSFDATPYDVDLTPNGLIAVVRGNNSSTPAMGSDHRVSF